MYGVHPPFRRNWQHRPPFILPLGVMVDGSSSLFGNSAVSGGIKEPRSGGVPLPPFHRAGWRTD